ncbi:MAG: thioesterase [Burkholderiales bacterium]|nr:thioesterase [Burkholderiales bacterium]
MSPRAPLLVFVSGLGGFDRIRVPGGSINYYRGLEDLLRQQDVAAFFPPQRPFANVAERAEFLARSLSGLPHDRIVFIAHSMGGLDCRFFMHHLDTDRRARTLVTIATPHRGTPIARSFLESRGPVQWLGRTVMRAALEDLTEEACERFNNHVPDRTDAQYLSYAAVRPIEETVRAFRPWTRLIAQSAGENDSQVPLSSAIWGTFKAVVRADHFELAGWSFGLPNKRFQRPFDHLAFYRRVLDDLSLHSQRLAEGHADSAGRDPPCKPV